MTHKILCQHHVYVRIILSDLLFNDLLVTFFKYHEACVFVSILLLNMCMRN